MIPQIMMDTEIMCEKQWGKKRAAHVLREPSEPPPNRGSSSHEPPYNGTHDCELSCEEYNRTSWGVGAWWTEPASDHHDLATCVDARDLVIQTGSVAVIQPAAKVVKMDEDTVVVSRAWLKTILDTVDRAEVCLSEKLWSCPFKPAPRLRN